MKNANHNRFTPIRKWVDQCPNTNFLSVIRCQFVLIIHAFLQWRVRVCRTATWPLFIPQFNVTKFVYSSHSPMRLDRKCYMMAPLKSLLFELLQNALTAKNSRSSQTSCRDHKQRLVFKMAWKYKYAQGLATEVITLDGQWWTSVYRQLCSLISYRSKQLGWDWCFCSYFRMSVPTFREEFFLSVEQTDI